MEKTAQIPFYCNRQGVRVRDRISWHDIHQTLKCRSELTFDLKELQLLGERETPHHYLQEF